MLKILRSIFKEIISEGFTCNFIIGTKEQITSEQADIPLFMFSVPRYRQDLLNFDKTVSFEYVIGYNSEQNSNDFESSHTQLNNAEVLHNLFIIKLLAYRDDNGVPIFQTMEQADVTPFLDLRLQEHPTTGLAVKVNVKQIATTHCVWQEN